jgi:Protein of unknown function (DUF3429)
MQPNSTLLRTLPYAGALPFMACAILLIFGIKDLAPLGKTNTIIFTYGLTIISFMAGVHWGQYVAGVRTRVNLLVSSNLVTLAAWFGFLLLPSFYFSFLLIVLFIILNSIDGHLRDEGAIESRYGKTRRNVTALVCLSLLIAAFA